MEKEITSDFNKAFRVSLKLKEGAPPHLYTTQLKQYMKDDTSLHPMMKRTLKMLKKTRTPYIKLSFLREVVFDCPRLRHFDRSADPRGNWVCTLWSDGEIEDFKKNPEEYIRTVLKFFKLLGYELYDSNVCKQDYLDMLQDVTSKQIKSQEEGLEK
jgi:hypothetical protein